LLAEALDAEDYERYALKTPWTLCIGRSLFSASSREHENTAWADLWY